MELSPPDPRIGQILQGRYKILARVAAGAMGVVYRGERVELARPVAVKFLHPWIAAQQAFRNRFETEARAMSRLNHPNCVSVIDFGFEGSPYVIMDFVTGSTLRQTLEAGALSPARAVNIARQILAGVGHAHAQGIIHRDLKPENLILNDTAGLPDHVRILDFGLAKLRDGPAMTSGLAIGTPSYMSPEQTGAPGEIDGRTDIYAIGIVLHEMLAGRKPFVSDKVAEILLMHRDQAPPRLRQANPGAGISTELEAVVLRALSKRAEDRFQTATEFVDALERTPEASIRPVAEPPVVLARPGAAGVARAPGQAPAPIPMIGDGDKTIADPSAFEPPRASGPAAAPGGAARPGATAAGASSMAGKWPWLVGPVVLALALVLIGLRRPPPRAGAKAGATSAAVPSAAGQGGAGAGAGVHAAAPAAVAAGAPGAASAPSAVTPPPPPPPPPSAEERLADANRLVASGEWEQALVVLERAHRENPQNAAVDYQLANLALDHKHWGDGAQAARAAAQHDPQYRSDERLVKNLIRGLSSDKGYEKTEDVLHGFGAPAAPLLKDAAAHDKNPVVRQRAADILRSNSGARGPSRRAPPPPSHRQKSHPIFSR